ncbi:hypothetical protein ACOMHN_035946 [Nucella lapillus]
MAATKKFDEMMQQMMPGFKPTAAVLSAVLTATTRSGRRWKNEMAIPFGSLRPRHTTVLSRRDVGQTRRLATPASKRTRNDA